MFDDFSSTNILIDNTNRVTGYVDSEVAAIVPLWKCATLPEWLKVTDHNDGWLEQGKSESDRQTLRFLFMQEAGYYQVGADWLDAAGASLWSYGGDWVNERSTWAEKHLGLGYPWLDHWN